MADNPDRTAFDIAIPALEAEVTNTGTHPTMDASARQAYARRIRMKLLSVALSVYTIATSEDRVSAARREAAVTGAGVAGGIAGGALAGLACGPAAPICVTVGAFVGGAVAAFGASANW